MVELYKRGASPYWYCVVSDPREPEGRIRKSTKPETVERLARLRKLSKSRSMKMWSEPPPAPVSRGLAPWRSIWSAQPGADSTIKAKVIHAGIITRSCLGDFDLAALTHADIKAFITNRRESFVPIANKPGTVTNRRVSDSTIRGYLSTMSSVYDWLADHDVQGAPEVNPFSNFNRRSLGTSQPVDRQYWPNQFRTSWKSSSRWSSAGS